jgi:hypothetical protein
MKDLRLYGAGLLVALLPTLVACNISGGGTGREICLNGVTYENGLFVGMGGTAPSSPPPEPGIPTLLPRPTGDGAGYPYPGPGGSGRAGTWPVRGLWL